MAKRILSIVAVLVVGYLVYLGYQRWKTNAQNESGAIQMDDTDSHDSASSNDSAPVARPQPAAAPAAPAVASAATIPAYDSVSANPTNGAAFTGKGKFQVYRQGNLTWRVDTESGHTCILFATMEEWKRPIVYNHGCNNS
jgi:hypothetical protein